MFRFASEIPIASKASFCRENRIIIFRKSERTSRWSNKNIIEEVIKMDTAQDRITFVRGSKEEFRAYHTGLTKEEINRL